MYIMLNNIGIVRSLRHAIPSSCDKLQLIDQLYPAGHLRVSSHRSFLTTACLLAYVVLAGCSAAAFRHEPLDSLDLVLRAQQQQGANVSVSAAVPSDQESAALFGIPLQDRGIQAVWLRVDNPGPDRARIVLSSIDREYFPPMEVAYMFRKRFSKQGWMDLESYLYENALPRHVPPGQAVSGFVFTHRSSGTKAFNVNVYRANEDRPLDQFTFFVEVPGFVPDHASVDFDNLYAGDERRELDSDGLRDLLQETPCCTTNRDGSAAGRPVDLLFVATGEDLLQALLRTGWEETSYQRDEHYLAAAHYLFGRPADAIFRKGRDRTTERMELAVWLSPYAVQGTTVWFGQTKHAIGRLLELGERLLGVRLDPDMAESRNFVLQDLWYGQSVAQWAWSRSGSDVSSTAPRIDFDGNPWFTRDPYRVVLWISGEPVAMKDVVPVIWDAKEVERGGTP